MPSSSCVDRAPVTGATGRGSYQARMGASFTLTMRSGASGNTKRTAPTPARSSSFTSGAKSRPSVPRPCSTIRVATGCAPGSGPVTVSRSWIFCRALIATA